MKRIGIDARLYFQTGVGVYTRNLLYYLQKNAPVDLTFYIYVMKEDSERISFTNKNFHKREVTAKWHSFSEQGSFFTTLQNDSLDLMHFTYFSYPVRYKKPFIATIHDVTPLLFKTGKASTKNKMLYEIKYQAFRYVLKNQVKHAQAVITPTITVKEQLTEFFGEKIQEKITSLYEGIDYELAETKENKILKKQFDFEFLIYIGNFYPHKNVEALVEAFLKTSISQKLVLIGPENYFSQRLIAKIEQFDQKERIIFYHNASTEDLVFFYKNAKAIINPSLSEGFGLPLVEAVYFNLPILASNIEVFKELLEDNYIAFDPTSIDSIQKSLEHFVQKKSSIKYEGIISKFSFEKMSDKTLKLYQKLLAS